MAITIGTPVVATQAGSNSWVVTLPSGMSNGDVCLVFLAISLAGSEGAPAPTGWTSIGGGSIANQTRSRCMARVIDGTEGSTMTVTIGSAATPSGFKAAVALSGVDTAGGLSGLGLDVATSASATNSSTTNVVANSLTTTTDNAFVIAYSSGGRGNGANSGTPGTGYTELVDQNDAGSTGQTLYVQYKIKSPAGSETPAWTAATSSSFVADAVAFRPVVAPAPSNTVAPVATGTVLVSQTLSVTNGTWTNIPTSYSYQWQRDSAGNGIYSNIGGATSNTYVLLTADTGNQVRCVVTATNASGSASANSNALGPVTGTSVTKAVTVTF